MPPTRTVGETPAFPRAGLVADGLPGPLPASEDPALPGIEGEAGKGPGMDPDEGGRPAATGYEISRNESAAPCPTPFCRTISVWLCASRSVREKGITCEERFRYCSVYSP